MKLKVGDKVKILSCTQGFENTMGNYVGKTTYITKINTDFFIPIKLNIDNGAWSWLSHRLEKVGN